MVQEAAVIVVRPVRVDQAQRESRHGPGAGSSREARRMRLMAVLQAKPPQDRLPFPLGPVDRRRARCRERNGVPRRKRVAHVVLFVVEDAGLDAVRAVVHELAADPGVAVEKFVQQLAVGRHADFPRQRWPAPTAARAERHFWSHRHAATSAEAEHVIDGTRTKGQARSRLRAIAQPSRITFSGRLSVRSVNPGDEAGDRD